MALLAEARAMLSLWEKANVEHIAAMVKTLDGFDEPSTPWPDFPETDSLLVGEMGDLGD